MPALSAYAKVVKGIQTVLRTEPQVKIDVDTVTKEQLSRIAADLHLQIRYSEETGASWYYLSKKLISQN